jgi:hypothetical protein
VRTRVHAILFSSAIILTNHKPYRKNLKKIFNINLLRYIFRANQTQTITNQGNRMNILETIQETWGTPGTPENKPAPQPEELISAGASGPGAELSDAPLSVDKFSCEYIGMYFCGRVSMDVDRDVSRLIEIMREHPIRPHLHEGGGSGFSYDLTWSRDHDALIGEFSLLWFTVAGDVIIARYRHLMHVIPHKDFDKPVGFRRWLKEGQCADAAGGSARVGTPGGTKTQGSRQARCFDPAFP